MQAIVKNIENYVKPKMEYDRYCDFITEKKSIRLYTEKKQKGVLPWQKEKLLSVFKNVWPADAA